MPDDVKQKRRYRSPRRARGAAETREAVLEAARRLFVADGFTRTTVGAIAAGAKVSPETIYSVFGTKRAILVDLVRGAVRGEEPDVPLLRQAAPQSLKYAADQRALLALFARNIADVLERVAPLMAVVREAAAAEPQLATLYRELHDGRRRNLAFVAEALLAKGPLRDGLDGDGAAAILWRLASPELFLLVRDIENLDRAAYATWLSDSLVRVLVAD